MDSGNDLVENDSSGHGSQSEFVGKMLTGSQRKTAYALRRNIEEMICGHSRRTLREVTTAEGKTISQYIADEPEKLHCAAFLTLTIGDFETDLTGRKRFVKIYDSVEASRRINNLNRRLLSDLFEKAVIVTERHADKGIHFHIVGTLRSGADIRTGFDFQAFREIRKSGQKFSGAEVGASPELAAIWKRLRETLPGYGFGRAELTPIEKTSEAVASYVAKYIEKNVCNRIAADRRKKLVRYLGFAKNQLKPNEFSWGTKRAIAWRCKARALAKIHGITEKEKCAQKFGARWAFNFTGTWKEIFGDDQLPWLVFTPNTYLRTLTALDTMAAKFERKLATGLSGIRAELGSLESQEYELTPDNRKEAWRVTMAAARDFERESYRWDVNRNLPITDEDCAFTAREIAGFSNN